MVCYQGETEHLVIKDWYLSSVLPRVVYIPYFIAKLLCCTLQPKFTFNWASKNRSKQPHLCVEAGARGWESIELKELYQSACEYLGGENVDKLSIQSNADYIEQILKNINHNKPTHYIYDPRTDTGGTFLKLWNSFRIALLFRRHAIVPIVILTDLSVRVARAQASIVSSMCGVVVSYVSVKELGHIFPHKRLLGPCLMPLSQQTLEFLRSKKMSNLKRQNKKALFVGALYEPRTTILNAIKSELTKQGYDFEIKGRLPGESRVSDEEYWAALCSAEIVVTTSVQGYHYKTSSGKMVQRGADLIEVPQLVYRYLEALACGTLLVAPIVPAIERYFTPWQHFIPYNTPEDAVKVISYYLDNVCDRVAIVDRGRKRAEDLISSRCFWSIIDSSLSQDSMF
jgi:hypothetical protein